jgi:nucleoside-diphosphate-sugar epimerase
MKILVVGGSGFLGKEIVKQLDAEGNNILSMRRSGGLIVNKNEIFADISKPESYKNFINDWRPQVVVQCAWVTAQKIYRQSPENLNYSSQTLQFAKDCFAAGTRHFIGLGSSAEYGIQLLPCDAANTKPNPDDPYGESKLKTMHQLHELANAENVKLTWARIFQPYGLGQDSERLIPWAAQQMLVGQEIKLQNPNVHLDWISSRDIARAISWCIKNATPEVIDIGTAIGTSVHQVLVEVAKIIGVNPELTLSTEVLDLQNTKGNLVVSPDSPLIQSGWRHKDSLQVGLSWALGR